MKKNIVHVPFSVQWEDARDEKQRNVGYAELGERIPNLDSMKKSELLAWCKDHKIKVVRTATIKVVKDKIRKSDAYLAYATRSVNSCELNEIPVTCNPEKMADQALKCQYLNDAFKNLSEMEQKVLLIKFFGKDYETSREVVVEEIKVQLSQIKKEFDGQEYILTKINYTKEATEEDQAYHKKLGRESRIVEEDGYWLLYTKIGQ